MSNAWVDENASRLVEPLIDSVTRESGVISRAHHVPLDELLNILLKLKPSSKNLCSYAAGCEALLDGPDKPYSSIDDKLTKDNKLATWLNLSKRVITDDTIKILEQFRLLKFIYVDTTPIDPTPIDPSQFFDTGYPGYRTPEKVVDDLYLCWPNQIELYLKRLVAFCMAHNITIIDLRYKSWKELFYAFYGTVDSVVECDPAILGITFFDEVKGVLERGISDTQFDAQTGLNMYLNIILMGPPLTNPDKLHIINLFINEEYNAKIIPEKLFSSPTPDEIYGMSNFILNKDPLYFIYKYNFTNHINNQIYLINFLDERGLLPIKDIKEYLETKFKAKPFYKRLFSIEDPVTDPNSFILPDYEIINIFANLATDSEDDRVKNLERIDKTTFVLIKNNTDLDKFITQDSSTCSGTYHGLSSGLML